MIKSVGAKIHWNYYLTLEADLEKVTRYVEFHDENFDTFSSELSKILLAASSEVDVILKQLCDEVSPKTKHKNIENYRKTIKKHLSEIIDEEIYVSRYGLSTKPFINWASENNPDWWHSYNNVKHHRGDCYREANLKNAINALGALLIIVTYYYKQTTNLNIKDTNRELNPQPSLIKLNDNYYYGHLLI